MSQYRRSEVLTAVVLLAPFVLVYLVLFVYPTAQMVMLTFTKSPLIGAGEWNGVQNYARLFKDRLFSAAILNTFYFVALTVIPSTIAALFIAMGVNRLKGWVQSVVLACFFVPYILPVSVVYRMWGWMLDSQFGIAQYPIAMIVGENVPIFRTLPLFMPAVAWITVWWLIGFNVLLFIAGLRNISTEVYEAARLDGATPGQIFRRITWPLIWPITVLVATIQLILQLKIFDQVYLFSQGGRTDSTIVMVQLIYRSAFQKNQGGYGATVALVLFLLIVILSVMQYQLLRARGEK
jgi:multiple sugar transport system permease protein